MILHLQVIKPILCKNWNIKTNRLFGFYFLFRNISSSGVKKKTKAKGSNKTGISCVARIKASVYVSHVSVEYCSTHIGYDCDIGRQRLHKEQRLQLAGNFSSEKLLFFGWSWSLNLHYVYFLNEWYRNFGLLWFQVVTL